VIAFNDLVALGLLARLTDLGVAVPRELSVVGVDDIPFARYSRPRLTTVSVPQGSLGAYAWTQLKDAMAGSPAGAPVWLQGTLIERESTGPAPV
jgi:LacI family transcriptional regulator